MTKPQTEFGIGEAGRMPASMPEDDLEAQRLQPRPRGATGTCDRCRAVVPRSWLMSASLGIVCPDCYDNASD
jgi:hypothetical protein